jgi:hypothetical protein
MLGHGFTPARYDPMARRLHPTNSARAGDNLLYVRNAQALESQLQAAPHRKVHGRSL